MKKNLKIKLRDIFMLPVVKFLNIVLSWLIKVLR